MPILLFETNAQKAIYILTDVEELEFLAAHRDRGMMTNIRDCWSSDLATLNVYAEGKRLETTWPLDNQILSEELIQKIAPIVSFEQRDRISEEERTQEMEDNEKCCRAFVPICKDREFIVMLLPQENETCFMSYVHNPNKMYYFGIQSVPVFHMPMINMNWAMSECLYEHASVVWERTTEGTYQRMIKDTEISLTWLRTSTDLYFNLVLPFLHMLQTIHEQNINHGDITDDNVVMSESMQQLFFIDFEMLGSMPYVDIADSAQNNTGYYHWHMARLYDLASLAHAVVNLANRYLPNSQETDCIVQYFSQLGEDLEEVCNEHEAYMLSDDCQFKLDTACIARHIDITIASVTETVQKLHTTRMASLTSSSGTMQVCATNADVCESRKLVRKFSIFSNESDSDGPFLSRGLVK
ncbi:MAG: hypothetical protein Q8R24_05380 [Legionellaceae bacterium]|nr:hypothetical protein [Legionellaceae bacterium]